MTCRRAQRLSADEVSAGAAVVAAAAVCAAGAAVLVVFLSLPQAVATKASAASDAKT